MTQNIPYMQGERLHQDSTGKGTQSQSYLEMRRLGVLLLAVTSSGRTRRQGGGRWRL